jgi:predicted component of type VI protein secretion system
VWPDYRRASIFEGYTEPIFLLEVSPSVAKSFWFPRLQYWRVACRFVQYLDVIMREKESEFESPELLVNYLRSWLYNYILGDPTSPDTAFRFPLGGASASLDENNGILQIYISIQPQLQLHEITGKLKPPSLEMTIKLDR